MKGKVIKSQRVIWSSETREVTVEWNGNTLIIRQTEDNNHGENWVSVNGGEFIETYGVEDEDLKNFADAVAYNIRNGDFDKEGVDFDTSEYDD